MPKLKHLVMATNNGFSSEQIAEVEIEVMKALGFRLLSPTLNMWTNLYLSEWDEYIKENPLHSEMLKGQDIP